MAKDNNFLYIFDLHNAQEEYSLCLEFIKILQDPGPPERWSDRQKRIQEIVDSVPIFGLKKPDGGKNYYEEPIKSNTLEPTASMDKPYVMQARRIKEVKDSFMERSAYTSVFHIRIHLDRNRMGEISAPENLRYLALMMQYLNINLFSAKKEEDKDCLKKRFSAFIVPSSGAFYPFQDGGQEVDTDTYEKVSGYLRLLSKEHAGCIYGVVSSSPVRVRALDFKRAAPLTDCSPLIPLTKETYATLFDEAESAGREALKRGYRIPGSKNSDPFKALGPFIEETAFFQFITAAARSGVDAEQLFDIVSSELRVAATTRKMSRLSFVILLFTLRAKNLNEKSIRENVRRTVEFANELSDGLRQLAQNTLQHSACHEGVFSFSLAKQGRDMAMRISLAEFNDQQTFADNFAENLRREANLMCNEERKKLFCDLAKNKGSISLGHFFGVYDGQAWDDRWSAFRRADTSAHIGLLLFSLCMQRCGGSLQLLNCKDFSPDKKNWFYHCYSESPDEPPRIPNRMIPGAQLDFIVPVGAMEKQHSLERKQLLSRQRMRETYESFSVYLDFQAKPVSLAKEVLFGAKKDGGEKAGQEMLVIDAETKFRAVSVWEHYWERQLLSLQDDENNHVVWYLDAGEKSGDLATYLENEDNIEIFLRGFLNAQDTLRQNDAPFLFAFINVTVAFLRILRRIVLLLGPKGFSPVLQLYAVGMDLEESIQLLGATFSDAVVNATILALEHGNQAYSAGQLKLAQEILSYVSDSDRLSEEERTNSRLICPFDVLLPVKTGERESIFDRHIRELAEYPMDKKRAGYKLENIHMRLGNKIHINAFYELAFLFYRTSISNRIAFEILKDLKENSDIQFLEDDIIFYGYASYSKAVLTSLLEILKDYRIRALDSKTCSMFGTGSKRVGEVAEHMASVSYQHNLQSDFQVEDTELYFNFYSNFLGERLNKDKVSFHRSVKVVQIVPISTTLTTFSKMEDRLCAEKKCEKDVTVKTAGRYTVFWVTDKYAQSPEQPRKETEGRYWEKVDSARRRISWKLCAGQNREDAAIQYFVRSKVAWDLPLTCVRCYPDDVIAEVPLVETDQTSTVPTQQLRGESSSGCTFTKDRGEDKENEARLIQLRSCVRYGHIRREKNHFAWYLETQNYFNKVKGNVQEWLKRCPHDEDEAAVTLDIIFSPEHATNVGFAQYVNNYYFDGGAEIVCVNESKEFRSNFKCEHMALIDAIDNLLKNIPEEQACPIRFYFVDDTIITGETFFKAVSFLHSLIPSSYQNLFPPNLIKKCFLLVDRLSTDSKRAYVRDVKKDFLSFLHVDLSNMRVQGDSCVGCKLEINAEKLLKRSATRKISRYWRQKKHGYQIQGYSEYSNPPEKESGDKAYRKLALSHILQNVLFYDNAYFELGEIYDSLLTVFAKIVNESPASGCVFRYDVLIEDLLRTEPGLELLKDFFKLIARPFFSFDFKVKLQALTLILVFSEFLISGDSFFEQKLRQNEELKNNPYKSFLYQNNRIAKTFCLLKKAKKMYLPDRQGKIAFWKDCLMDNLVELRSTYMMRKETLQKMLRFVPHEDPKVPGQSELVLTFWDEYAAGLHEILDCSNEETRSIWLEYLLVNGEEYNSQSKEYIEAGERRPCFLFDALEKDSELTSDSAFGHFCNELFLQNSRVQFDELERRCGKSTNSDSNYWKLYREMDGFCIAGENEAALQEEITLFSLMKKPEPNDGQYKVTERYKKLLKGIVEIAKKKYSMRKIDIALITYLDDRSVNADNTTEISQLDIVSDVMSSVQDVNFRKYTIKQNLIKALKSDKSLHDYGYRVYPCVKDCEYFFIYFDSDENPIVPVYLYFGTASQEVFGAYKLWMLLRDILSYRNRLLRMLKSDFAGDTFPQYAHTAGEKNILAHEKATSHNTTGDDSATLDIFLNPKSVSKYKTLDSNQVLKWLLLRNYTNAQIAKLFNRNYRAHEGDSITANFPNPPPLYLTDTGHNALKSSSGFERPLRKFSDLRLQHDGRISMLNTAISLDVTQVAEAIFLKNEEGQYYNVEYFKNILIDIIITAMKYARGSATYLERVDQYLTDANMLGFGELLSDDQKKYLEQQRCEIWCEIEKGESTDVFDYLVIRNNVKISANNMFDWEVHNQRICARLDSPIDNADGHMSLFTIAQYIEGLWPDRLHRRTSFKYVPDDEGKLFFETKLPIIEKDGSC